MFYGCKPRNGITGSYGNSTSRFFKETSYYSPQWLYQFPLPPTVLDGPLFSTPCLEFTVCRFDGHSHQHEVLPQCCFELHLMMILSIFSCAFWTYVQPSLEKCLFRSSVHFHCGFFFFFFTQTYMSCLYILEFHPLPLTLFAVFSPIL